MEKRRKLNSDDLKMSQVVELLLLFLALLFLSSCGESLPVPQEMGNMALLRTFAVDTGTEENWLVTVSTGKQAKGLAGNLEPASVFSAESASLQGACRQIDGMSENFVFYGYIDQLLIGEELAREGIGKILEYFSSNKQLSLSTGIWLCYGQANDLMSDTKEEGTEEHLSTLVEESKLGVAGISRKVGEVLTDIYEGNASYIPILSQNEQGILQESGYGILRGEKLVGLFQEELAMGLSLLEGQDQLLELEWEDEIYAVDLSQICRKVTGEYSDQKLNSVELTLSIEGEILEYPVKPDESQLLSIQTTAEEELIKICKSTIFSLQNINADPLGLANDLSLWKPQWKESIAEDWDEIFSMLDFTIVVDLSLKSMEGN